MARKIFLSFLGTNDYVPCNYFLEDHPEKSADNVKYIQEALLQLYGPTFSDSDKCYFFLTDLARHCNWRSNGQFNRKTKKYTAPNKGLRQRLMDLKKEGQLPAAVVARSIPEGFSSGEIWEIFQVVFSCLEKGDRVILDITHAFRSLPMLGMVMISYAKALKDIEVEAIFYGAFEKLGHTSQVKKLQLEKRNAPILDLSSFSELQDWTAAAHDFVQYGKPGKWSELTSKTIQPILKETRGKDQVAANLRRISNLIIDFTALIATNRGGALMAFDFERLNKELEQFSVEESYIKPLNAIIEQVKDKIAPFKTQKELLWLESAAWCKEHGLVQQGITQLQEGILTFLCSYFNQKTLAPGFFDWQKKKARDLITGCLNVVQQKKPEYEWYGELKKNKNIARSVTSDMLVQKLAPNYAGLTQIRNDISHGGYTKKKKASAFYKNLNTHYTKIRQILEEHMEEAKRKPSGLLNLSNHPSDGWPANQIKAARNEFGNISDLPFPNVDPAMSNEELEDLVDQYYTDIRARRPAAVHLMGEMTFTFALVQKLKAAGIPCLASTTNRLVTEEDGNKVVQFQFVRFREY